MGDQNDKVYSDNAFFNHAMGWHGLSDLNNGEKFADFCNFHRLKLKAQFMVTSGVSAMGWTAITMKKYESQKRILPPIFFVVLHAFLARARREVLWTVASPLKKVFLYVSVQKSFFYYMNFMLELYCTNLKTSHKLILFRSNDLSVLLYRNCNSYFKAFINSCHANRAYY